VGAPDPVVYISAAGAATNARDFRVRLNGDSIIGKSMDYYEYAKVSKTVSMSQMSTGTASFQVTNLCTASNDRMVISKVELTYPRKFHFSNAINFSFEIPANTAGNYLEIAGFTHSGTIPVLYDLTNGKRYEGVTTTPSLVKIALLPSSVDRKLVLVSEAPANVRLITSLEQRNFVNYQLAGNQGNYIIITNELLTAASGGADPVEEYRQYRSSPQGGSYNARVYLIDQLEDQFGLGIKRHPLSIRNFLRWARVKYPLPLKSVLLIGKGVIYTQFINNQGNANIDKLNLVPTFGFPASDNLLTAEGNSSVPLTPIGRISVINKDEIADYLEKVKQYELRQSVPSSAIEDKAWMKNIIHVTGASDNNTTDILLEALDGQKRIIEDTLYAGNVTTFTKYSADAVQQVASARLTNLFKEGLGLLTYFGHSSASTLEFNLDNPQNYDNKGKYPVFIVMGCNAGAFFNFKVARFSTKETISERFVLAKERGAIAFLASTHLGIVHYLDIYNSKFYRAMSTNRYGATLGEIMDEAVKQVFAITSENDFYARFQCEQFTLNGDPALKLYHFDKPDYVIEDPLVKISPSFITVDVDHFDVKVNFMNIGKAVTKDIIVELKRTYPDNSVAVIRRDTIPFTKFMDSLSYIIPVVASRDRGLNKITVTVDAGNKVDEIYETNNTVTKDFYIIEDDVKPVYPYNFSIINKQNVNLVASTADPFAVSKSYVMEIDTTTLYNSPLKVRSTISSTGGVIEFSPGMTFTDKTVYYWRVANNVTSGELVWNESSFIYMDGPEVGFNQSHLYQHLKSKLTRITLDSTSRQWNFGLSSNNIFVRNGVYPTTSDQGGFYSGTINDVDGFIGPGCNFNEIIFNVIHPVTFVPWKNDYSGATGLYQSFKATCGSGREYNFQYMLSDINWRQKAMDFINNVVPDGHFVVVRSNSSSATAVNTYANVWQNDQVSLGAGNSLYHTLFNQGFLDVGSFDKPRSFIAMFKKNRQNEFATISKFSEGIYDAITLDGNAISPDTLGVVVSPLMGPAKAWKRLEWEGLTLDNPNSDIPLVDIIGVNSQGNETTLVTGITPSQTIYDLTSIDAQEYPYMKLKMVAMDTVKYTPYQLKHWRLYYNPVPEGAVASNIYFTTKDTVSIGQVFDFGIAFKNVSQIDFDSLKVKFAITDKNNVENIVPVPRQKALIPGDTIKLNVPIDTKSLSGHNTIFVNFNPDNDQPEQYLFNNYAFRNLYVIPDSLNPVMDVTFDGTHILNKDIISAKPKILVKLSDEMRSLLLDDTSLVTVSVRYPSGDIRRFSFNNNDTLQFVPAGQGENTANVIFNPYFPEDGEYELIVIGKDRSGNYAGNVQYKVSFTIINKPMISNMLNYPNPFTTSTAFVFTVTGSEVPQNIRIQVLTITGKIVREITKDELGPLHIGRNITEFKWNGTDEYGQKLANGIYLYRVITNLNGKALDKYKTKDDTTDRYFNKGYGKMYLMR
ncbi:MAG: putative type IX secretion system sortase PorU2, partial [Chitinophagaceae bacterium]